MLDCSLQYLEGEERRHTQSNEPQIRFALPATGRYALRWKEAAGLASKGWGVYSRRLPWVLRFALAALLVIALRDMAGGWPPADDQSNVSLSGPLPEACESTSGASPQLVALLKEVKSHPTAEAFSAIGSQFAKQDQHSCAVAAFRAALERAPSSWKDHYNLGLALARMGDQKQAAAELRMVVQQEPDYFPARHALGLALQSLGDLDAAGEQFQAALKIDPHSGAASFGLAQIYEAQGKNSAALYYLHQTLASHPPRSLCFRRV